MAELAIEVGEAVWNQTGMSTGNWASVSLDSYLVASDFVLESAKTLVRMSVLMSDDDPNDNGIFDSFSGVLSYAIYADNGGKPGVLIATGTFANLQVTDTGRQESTSGYDTFLVSGDFAAPIELTTGTYWFSIGENAYGSASDGSPIWWERSAAVIYNHYASAPKASPGAWALIGATQDNAFALFDNSSITFAENTVNAAPQLIDTNARILTTANYNTGSLTVSGLLAEDRVSIIAGNGITVDGTSVLYNNAVIGSFTGGVGNAFVVTFGGTVGQAAMTALIQQLGYANVSDTPTLTRTLLINAVDSTGSGTPFLGSPVTIKVNAEAEPPAVAVADTGTTNEDVPLNGNVLTNDTGLDTETVAAVNGDATAVGKEITLPSGARLTLNADGTYTYDPAGAFHLVTPATGSHNVATDSFTYTLSGGGTATVTITVNGVDQPGDWIYGTSGSDTIVGTSDDDVFILNQASGLDDDEVDGGEGDDIFFMQDTLSGGDRLRGGPGADTVILQGDYDLNINGLMLSGIETLKLLAGDDNRFGTGSGALRSYTFSINNDVVAPGQRLTVDGSGLRAGEDVWFDGSGVADGSFAISTGAGDDTLWGGNQGDFFAPGSGADRISGGMGTDAIYMGAELDSGDIVDGGDGNDILGLQGDYAAFTFSDTLTSIETLVLLSGSFTQYSGGTGAERFDYDLTTLDANVAAGQTLVVNATQLLAGEDLRFDGSAETDGGFWIISGAGNDTLIGGAGNDTFIPQAGQDIMTGGGGNDLFYYRFTDESPASAPDSITDFTAGDHIAVYGLGVPGGLGISFIGDGEFGEVAGQLRVTGSGTSWLVEIDVDGDGDADFAIDVTTTVSGYEWGASDFIF